MRSMKPQVARSLICAAGSLGLKVKSNSESVRSSSKRARWTRRARALFLPALDLVLEHELQELQVPEPLFVRLIESQLQGLEHPAELEALQAWLQLQLIHRPNSPTIAWAPCRCAPATVACGSSS